MKVKLVMFKQDGQRRDFELKRDTATLGRNTDCDFQIPLAMISRRHSQLFVKNGQLLVRDLGSSNGTFVNNKRIQESELHAGDTLVIGPVIFTIVIDGEPTDITPKRTIVGEGAAVAATHPETEGGTVDVEEGETEDVEVVQELAESVDEVEEKNDEEEVEEVEEDAAGGSDALSALEALSKKKKE